LGSAGASVGLAVILFAALSAHAQMYKCVDERGVTHYSDQPRAGCKGARVDIQASPPPAGGAPRAEDFARQDADFKRRQLERERAEAADKASLEQRCAGLRQEHAVLASGIRVGKITAEGERDYIDDATRDARLGQIKEALRACR
jgi:hypothetical protein